MFSLFCSTCDLLVYNVCHNWQYSVEVQWNAVPLCDLFPSMHAVDYSLLRIWSAFISMYVEQYCFERELRRKSDVLSQVWLSSRAWTYTIRILTLLYIIDTTDVLIFLETCLLITLKKKAHMGWPPRRYPHWFQNLEYFSCRPKFQVYTLQVFHKYMFASYRKTNARKSPS